MPRVNDSGRPTYSAIGQLMMHFTDNIWYSGSGALISNTQVLTCGHNIIARDGHYADEIRFYSAWNQGAIPVVAGPVAGQTAHIRAQCAFYGNGYQNGEDKWDIGLVHLAAPVNLNPPHAYFSMQTVNDNSLVEQNLSIAGYPGNHPGEMWLDHDVVEGISIPNNSLFHLHETAAGSSGSPMYIYDAESDLLRLYAVHVQAPNMLRRATLLTPAIRQKLTTAQAHVAHGGPFTVHPM